MRTYRELFRSPEYTPFFLTGAAQIAASTVSGLALGTLVYLRTGSPLLSALALFGPSLAQLLGATTMLSAVDRLPPRAALTGVALLLGVGTALQAIPGLPLYLAFAVLFAQGVVASLGSGVRYGLLHEIVPRDGFLLGRAVLAMSAGVLQICGYAAGGVLVALLSARGTLLAGAALHAVAAATAFLGLSARRARASGRPSVAATWRTNRLLWASRQRRAVYLALWVPHGLVVGCESLFVSYAPRHAGLLFAVGAAGMLAGDTVAGRFLPTRWRVRMIVPLRLLLAAPYLLFVLRPGPSLAAAAVLLASAGFSASLLLQDRLTALTPDETAGHAQALQASGRLAMQGVGAALAGGVAQVTSPAVAMTLLAAASAAVTLSLAPGLRPRRPGAADPLRKTPAGITARREGLAPSDHD
jgi:MFS family permease